MKLAISNIAWENSEFDEHLNLISKLGCKGIEIAPSCIWPEPLNSNSLQRRELKNKISDTGLTVVGLHALLFTRPDLELFDTKEARENTKDYLKRLFELCADLGGKYLTYGSPRSRRVGNKSYVECTSIFCDFIADLMSSAKESNVVLCVEPLSKKESDFITSSSEAYNIVKKINHPHLGLQLDIKALIDAQEDFRNVFLAYGKELSHLHVGDVGLAPPGSVGFDHKPIGDAVKLSGYDGFISIEMRKGFGPSQTIIQNSIEYVRQCYSIE